jgi:adenosyl cobinamide kinase/adenosyl cobinamide phosphate guanylyltransferase
VALVLLIGGARSGKSELAVRLAGEQDLPVVFIATGAPGDPEMSARIAAHRRERPAEWQTVEVPLELRNSIARVTDESCLIVDCLTLWTANALAALGASATEEQAVEIAALAAARRGLTIVVTNEVGLGIVPDNPLGREYRDLLGRVNEIWADAAEEAYMMVAGRALALQAPESMIGGLA